MGLKTLIRKMLNVPKCDSFKNYKKCICDKSVVFREGSAVESYHGKESVIIGSNSDIAGLLQTQPTGGQIIMGKNCYVGKNSCIRSAAKVELGNHVLIAYNTTVFDNNSHPIDPIKRRVHMTDWDSKEYSIDLLCAKPVKICDDAWIGCNCVILKGVTIGECAIVGAGSVVTRDVEPWTIVAGNPAKLVKRIEH